MQIRYPGALALVLFLVIICLMSCNTMEGQWEKAKQANTVDTYENFIDRYTDSRHTDEALSAIVSLHYEAAAKQHTVEAYEGFTTKYPDSPESDEARSQIVELEYQTAGRAGTAEAYEAFIGKYPDSPESDEARSQIVELEYQAAGRDGTVGAYEAFIGKYPETDQAISATARIAELKDHAAWKSANDRNSVKAYRAYLRKYPKGAFTGESESRISELNSYKGTVESWFQLMAFSQFSGAKPSPEIYFLLLEHASREFLVTMKDALRWGLIEKGQLGSRVVSKGWRVRFEVNENCETTTTDGVKKEACPVISCTKLGGS